MRKNNVDESSEEFYVARSFEEKKSVSITHVFIGWNCERRLAISSHPGSKL